MSRAGRSTCHTGPISAHLYDKDHMSALRIKNISESDPRSYEATNKAQKKIRGTAKITFTYILYPQRTHTIFIVYTSCHSLHITGIN